MGRLWGGCGEVVELPWGAGKDGAAQGKLRRLRRRTGDAKKLKNFPTPKELKQAVHDAMLALQGILASRCNAANFTRGEQGTANAAVVGIIFCNGFGGRKLEWESMLASHVTEQLNAGRDHLVCPEHKTSHVYGDLAKWIAPGTIEALKVYLKFPRRSKIATLLVPCDGTTEFVSVPKALHRFCQLFLVKDRTRPTVNLLRKWYHTELVRQTRITRPASQTLA